MRTTLAIKEKLLDEVKALSGVKTKKEAVEMANRPEDQIFLVFVPTSFNGTSVNLLILKSSLAMFCTGRYFFND